MVRKNKFKLTNRSETRVISKKLDLMIKKLQSDLQRKENIEFGRKSQTVTYQFASQALGKVMEGFLK